MKKNLLVLPPLVIIGLALAACTRSASPSTIATEITCSINQIRATGGINDLIPPSGGTNTDYRKAAAALGDITVVAKSSGAPLGTLHYPYTKAQEDTFLSACYAKVGGYANASVRHGVTWDNGIIFALSSIKGASSELAVREQPEAILAALGTAP